VTTWVPSLARELTERYELHDVELIDLGAPVNDVMAVAAVEGEFALKLYHRGRTRQAVQWEVDLLIHLHRRGAPVAQPVRGRGGYLQSFDVNGQRRVAVLFAWAPGAKPAPGDETYRLLGEAAARIHSAADGFDPSPIREKYDAAVLIDNQLQRMRPLLLQAGRWRTATALGERMQEQLAEPSLDRGICHMDLTLDNVHVAEDLTVFDFDSAGTCWRAVEPWGVVRFPRPTSRRGWPGTEQFALSAADETAVATFGSWLILGWWPGSSDWPNPRAANRCSPLWTFPASWTAGSIGKLLI